MASSFSLTNSRYVCSSVGISLEENNIVIGSSSSRCRWRRKRHHYLPEVIRGCCAYIYRITTSRSYGVERAFKEGEVTVGRGVAVYGHPGVGPWSDMRALRRRDGDSPGIIGNRRHGSGDRSLCSDLG